MFKLIRILICFFVFFIFTFPVNAFDFVKNSNNPLNITYLNEYAYPFQAHIYKEDNRCKGILAARKPSEAYHGMVAIESEDCFDWAMTKEILNIGQDISDPRLFINSDGSKKIFFTKADGKDFYRIYSTDCDNDLNCSSDISLVLDPNKSDLTEINGYFASYVIIIDGRYYMFYGAWGQDGFKIRMAYSDNLESWQKCPNNMISNGGDGPFPYLKDNNLYLFYHKSDSSGIKLAKTILPLSCNSVFEDLGYLLRPDSSYDIRHLIFPSVIDDSSGLKLYYFCSDWNWNWSLNLACTGEACILPTPTPTVVPSKTPIIIIPGFMASWNKEAILHNKTVNFNQWHLLSFVKEYDGIIASLKNLGYEENKDFFLFTYDWRKKVDETVDDLNNFINSKIDPDQKVNLIGHSLGGIVGRIYSQKYLDKNRVEKLVTVASPHSGVVQVYKPLEAGEIDRENTFLWLMEKVIINLNRDLFQTDREVVQNMLSVTYDLFPTFNFLKDEKDQFININSLKISNQTLNSYNKNFHSIFSFFTALFGEKDSLSTIAGYKVSQPNAFNNIFDNYQDGQPTEAFKDKGDYLVLSESAKNNEDASYFLSLDHGEMIYKKQAIEKIFEVLGINYLESQINEGEKTIISPSLIFLIKSPATMEIAIDDKDYLEDDGIIFIDNAQTGEYKLKVKGIDQGKYQVVIGQIGENNDVWGKIDGEITQIPASNQVDDYLINFNSSIPITIPYLTPSLTPSPNLTPILTPTSTLTLNSTSTASSNASQTQNNQPSNAVISQTPLLSSTSLVFSPTTITPEVLGTTTNKEVKKKNYLFELIISAIPVLSTLGYYLKKFIFKKRKLL